MTQVDSSPTSPTAAPALMRPLLLMGIALIVVATIGGALVARHVAWRQQQERLATEATLQLELLRSELERHRLLPTILAQDASLAAAVTAAASDGATPGTFTDVSARLEALADRDGAVNLYLIASNAIAIAASNYRRPDSFVGRDYQRFTYFHEAMASGYNQFFARGTTSRLPGLFMAQRLASGNGIIVVKVVFDSLEQGWRDSRATVRVVDSHDIVVLTDDPAPRLQPLAAWPVASWRNGLVTFESAVPGIRWRMLMQRDRSPELLSASLLGAAISGMASALGLGGIAWFATARARRMRAQAELHAQVAERTRELHATNQLLLREMEERTRSEADLQRARSDLISANKLAVLGQITAGVAHEINQPVAAIRNYVDNAEVLLTQGRLQDVARNLQTVGTLTERIGSITSELRTFSRQPGAASGPVALDDAIDGALALMQVNLRHGGISIERVRGATPLHVTADRTRLEQVFVNLLQNAADALADCATRTIAIRTGSDGEWHWAEIADSGPGIPEDRTPLLFKPFVSSKPMGLGLGLIICKDIVERYGGTLTYQRSHLGGAAFRMQLGARE